jgi:hypothetical protein
MYRWNNRIAEDAIGRARSRHGCDKKHGRDNEPLGCTKCGRFPG